ncbi:hypothetical protein ACEQ8H_003806 [Pleosporales sp. CAS-2024a]
MADRGRGRGQRGRRGGGNGRGGAAAASGRQIETNICFEFQKTGTCKRAHCRFSHMHALEDGKPAQRKNAHTKQTESHEQRLARKSYSAWKRHLGSEATDSHTMQRLWGGAVNILEEGDRNLIQQLARDLDSDDKEHNGRQHVVAILTKRVTTGDASQHIRNYQQFLLTMIHSSLIDCLAVDTYVGSLYNLISGANGTRAVPSLQHMYELLIKAREENDPDVSFDILDSTLVAMSVILRELLRRESRARFNQGLEALADALEAAAADFAIDKPSLLATLVAKNMRCVRDMVARAKGMLLTDSSQEADVAASATKPSSYPRDLVIPSGRHDNDKLDITDIVIFPTRDEIMSDAKEFLPFTDPDQFHFLENPTQRHIDTHFRLFRHDVFGELKGTLGRLMQTYARDQSIASNPHFQLGDVRTYRYTGAYMKRIHFDRALEIHMSFEVPLAIVNRSFAARNKWWEESKRLEAGSLLSFIWLQDGTVQHVFLKLVRKGAKDDDGTDLDLHDEGVVITVRLMTEDRTTFKLLMRAAAAKSLGMLLEFPRIMPATFVPILENLQDMQRTGGLPFDEWILPAKHNNLHNAKICHDIPPPLYARLAGFRFALNAITKDPNSSLCVDPTLPKDYNGLLDEIEAQTSLDSGQCRALVAALMREFAFIQGPPGTGKSFLGLHLMQVLLRVKEKTDLGPILVVCYTNHALDQFLEHLVNIGIKKVIRVGRQSKSSVLANHNLQLLRRSESNTKSEKSSVWEAYNALGTYRNNANDVLGELRRMRNRPEWQDFEGHIMEEYENIYSQFSRVDDEGFTMVGRHPFDMWCHTGTIHVPASEQVNVPKPIGTLANILHKANANVYSLKYQERQFLISRWVEEIHEAKVSELYEIMGSAAAEQKILDNVHAEASRRILQGADVIGVTTSGLAGRISLLKRVACKVLICEEAGEILEPHMISALLPSIQHCIQIGDHEQLRPSVSNFEDLSLESEGGKAHQLDVSQFERLSIGVVGRPLVPVAQLNVQRRMHPEISMLIRETLYAKLVDHDSTMDTPSVVGLRENVFWLDHTNQEDATQTEVQHTKSKSNSWEVQMVHALVRHIIRQGTYKSNDIAVLTPYTGQLQKLRAEMRDDFEIVLSDRDEEALEKDGYHMNDDKQPLQRHHVDAAAEQGRKPLEKKKLSDLLRIATVDNFQGEEAKVVIISLVRSNKKQNVGFLKTSNRINVLLSRAKHGMYLIGNVDTYSHVKMWHQVIGMLRAKGSVGPALGLCCPRHPAKIIQVQSPEDFAKCSPEGGCVRCLAKPSWLAGTNVLELAVAAIARRLMINQSSSICDAWRSAVERWAPVIIPARELVMMVRTVACAKSPARYNASTPDVLANVTSRVRLVAKAVNGLANIKMDEKPDMIEFKPYSDIDVDETPIIALGCGHFFTVDTLDGHVSLNQVYQLDNQTGRYAGLIENPQLAAAVPQCPYCKTPIRQWVTQRYNRLVNKAVIDEMTKRFIVSSQQELHELETALETLECNLESCRTLVIPDFTMPVGGPPSLIGRALEYIRYTVEHSMQARYAGAQQLENRLKSFQKRTATKQQPSSKLHQATMYAMRKKQNVHHVLDQLSLSSVATTAPNAADERITYGSSLLSLKVQSLVLEDKFWIRRFVKTKVAGTGTTSLPDCLAARLTGQAKEFLDRCDQAIEACIGSSLPKLAVQMTLSYSRIAHLLASSGSVVTNEHGGSKHVHDYRDRAKQLLHQAAACCKQPFHDSKALADAVERWLSLLGNDLYTAVSQEEIESIKKAMISGGPRGIATHSGHWYKCINNHPFAIGECGMPMERATCPECGEPVGGQNHAAVAGVTRAREMEG